MKKYSRIIIFLLVCLFTLISKDSSAALFGNSQKSGAKLFNSNENKSSRLSPFPKWTGMLDRYYSTIHRRNQHCAKNSRGKSCNLKDWRDVISMLQDKDIYTKLKYVNKYNNSIDYITDPKNWHLPDYWATPFQFLDRNGDCEDYAISKYIALKDLGVPSSSMRVVVLMDNNLQVYHSVLAVYVENEIYILDNQIETVVSDKKIYHYSPVFSINETNWWRHY